MPNRILRDWTDSAIIDKLTWQEEVLFTRLIMKADDFGNYYRDSSLVKSLLFPRKDGLRPSDIERWLQALEATDTIRCYPAKGDSFLHIVNFGQRLDRTARKFPKEPDSISDDNHPPQLAATGSETPPEVETKRSRNEVETVVAKTASPQQQISENDSFLFQMFKNCSNWKTELILQEVGKFKNKYPDLPLNKSGSVVNSWVANYKPIEKTETKPVKRFKF